MIEERPGQGGGTRDKGQGTRDQGEEGGERDAWMQRRADVDVDHGQQHFGSRAEPR